jgi:hypothetical protein
MHVHLSFSTLEGNEDENDEVYEVLRFTKYDYTVFSFVG